MFQGINGIDPEHSPAVSWYSRTSCIKSPFSSIVHSACNEVSARLNRETSLCSRFSNQLSQFGSFGFSLKFVRFFRTSQSARDQTLTMLLVDGGDDYRRLLSEFLTLVGSSLFFNVKEPELFIAYGINHCSSISGYHIT